MKRKRRTDPEALSVYRAERVVSQGGKWFFYTREGTIEGPFRDKITCLNQLDVYIKVMQSGMLSEENDEHFRSHYQTAS